MPIQAIHGALRSRQHDGEGLRSLLGEACSSLGINFFSKDAHSGVPVNARMESGKVVARKSPSTGDFATSGGKGVRQTVLDNALKNRDKFLDVDPVKPDRAARRMGEGKNRWQD